MRLTLPLLLVLTTMAVAPDAAAKPRVGDVLAAHGLGGDAACLIFVDARAVDHRKDRWRTVIEELWQSDPAAVLDWTVGASKPPAAAVAEATKQRDCMLELIVHDAADPSSRLILDFQKENATKASMQALGARYASSSAFRSQLHASLTESDHRDAHTQSWIWKRKFVFSGRNFNVVSPRAAERCGLEAHESWKPDSSRHRECWSAMLTPSEREREILQASAAPGISRHHWGTDFDIFALAPAMFRTGRYADEYLWMTHNALLMGFFQPYTSREVRGERYMEERWHWSYYPIAQALLEFAAAHDSEVAARLEELWQEFETRWNPRGEKREFFTFVRAHWREFMFNVDTSIVRSGL